MGMTLTPGCNVASGAYCASKRSSATRGPYLPGLTMAAEKVRRNQTTHRYNPVWEESEMGLWRKIRGRAGI